MISSRICIDNLFRWGTNRSFANIIGTSCVHYFSSQVEVKLTVHPLPQPKQFGKLNLLHADAHIAVIEKPSGLLSVPGSSKKGLDCAVYQLRAILDNDSDIPQCTAPSNNQLDPDYAVNNEQLERRIFEEGLKSLSRKSRRRKRRKAIRDGTFAEDAIQPAPIAVHRLDMATSGVMVFARHKRAARLLSAQFANRSVKKQYEAILDTRYAELCKESPILENDTGEICTPLGTGVCPYSKLSDPFGGKPTHTKWEVLERGQGAVRVKFTPSTGRSHQLRLHAAMPPPFGLNSPIYGDPIYPHPYPGPCTVVGIMGRSALTRDHEISLNTSSSSNETHTNARFSPMCVVGGPYETLLQQMTYPNGYSVPDISNLKAKFELPHIFSPIVNQLPYPHLESSSFLNHNAISKFSTHASIQFPEMDPLPFFVPRLLLHATVLEITENYLSKDFDLGMNDIQIARSTLTPFGNHQLKFTSAAPF